MSLSLYQYPIFQSLQHLEAVRRTGRASFLMIYGGGVSGAKNSDQQQVETSESIMSLVEFTGNEEEDTTPMAPSQGDRDTEEIEEPTEDILIINTRHEAITEIPSKYRYEAHKKKPRYSKNYHNYAKCTQLEI